MVKVNSGEWFLTINGTGLGNQIVFDGPAGHFQLTANAVFSTSVVCWVPLEIVANSGYYSVYVMGGTGTSNTVTFEVRGFRFFPLVLLVPEILRAQPISRSGAYVKYEVMPLGGEDPNPVVRCFPESGSLFKMGLTQVDCTASNSAGEKASASFTVTVRDEEEPRISVPEPIQVRATSREGAIVDYKTSAYDDIWGYVETDCAPKSGSVFPIGVTHVRCHATDVDGNTAHSGFEVEVLGESKYYELTLLVPEETVSIPARDASGSIYEYDVKVTGTDDRNPDLTCLPKSGEVFPIGQTVVVCDAIDYLGMRGHAEFPVDVFDLEAPLIEKAYATPADLSPADGRIVPIEVTASATDAIDLRPTCSVYSVTANEPIDVGDDADPEKEYDWKITGPMTLELRARADSAQRIYNVWVGCSDWYGNLSSASIDVVVWNEKYMNSSATSSKRRSVGGKP